MIFICEMIGSREETHIIVSIILALIVILLSCDDTLASFLEENNKNVEVITKSYDKKYRIKANQLDFKDQKCFGFFRRRYFIIYRTPAPCMDLIYFYTILLKMFRISNLTFICFSQTIRPVHLP